MKNNFGNNLPLVNLHSKRSLKSKLETQLLYGDSFKVIKKFGSWKKIKIKKDGYVGYIKSKGFSKPSKPNFKVSVLKARLFNKPSSKQESKKFLPYESRVKIIKRKRKFGQIGKYWIKIADLKNVNYRYKDIFNDIGLFKNIKYLWGGKSYEGIDCSALVQIFLNYNNRFCPRNSKDQEKYFKKKVKLNRIRKNDIIFWKGHVAIAISKKKLIHAYGPMKKVVVMDIKKTIERIERTANLKVLSIRRI